MAHTRSAREADGLCASGGLSRCAAAVGTAVTPRPAELPPGPVGQWPFSTPRSAGHCYGFVSPAPPPWWHFALPCSEEGRGERRGHFAERRGSSCAESAPDRSGDCGRSWRLASMQRGTGRTHGALDASFCTFPDGLVPHWPSRAEAKGGSLSACHGRPTAERRSARGDAWEVTRGPLTSQDIAPSRGRAPGLQRLTHSPRPGCGLPVTGPVPTGRSLEAPSSSVPRLEFLCRDHPAHPPHPLLKAGARSASAFHSVWV